MCKVYVLSVCFLTYELFKVSFQLVSSSLFFFCSLTTKFFFPPVISTTALCVLNALYLLLIGLYSLTDGAEVSSFDVLLYDTVLVESFLFFCLLLLFVRLLLLYVNFLFCSILTRTYVCV